MVDVILESLCLKGKDALFNVLLVAYQALLKLCSLKQSTVQKHNNLHNLKWNQHHESNDH
jgi:hypothetical protein